MGKTKRPLWFRLYSQNTSTINAIDSEKLGSALKLAMNYFDSGGTDETIEQNISDIEVKIAFAMFKQNIDESFADYQQSVDNGRKGQRVKQERQSKVDELLEKFGGDEKEPKPPLSPPKGG